MNLYLVHRSGFTRSWEKQIHAESPESAAKIFFNYYRSNISAGDTIKILIKSVEDKIKVTYTKRFLFWKKTETFDRPVSRTEYLTFPVILSSTDEDMGNAENYLKLGTPFSVVESEEDFWGDADDEDYDY